jgi:hypothetical protein
MLMTFSHGPVPAKVELDDEVRFGHASSWLLILESRSNTPENGPRLLKKAEGSV